MWLGTVPYPNPDQSSAAAQEGSDVTTPSAALHPLCCFMMTVPVCVKCCPSTWKIERRQTPPDPPPSLIQPGNWIPKVTLELEPSVLTAQGPAAPQG